VTRCDPGRVLVLGAGPTGLGAAWRLRELGHDDHLVVEAAAGPGGLAASVTDEAGFTWDFGGHVQFSHYRYYDRVLDTCVRDGWLWHQRSSSIWLGGRFIGFPIQQHLGQLEPEHYASARRELEAPRPHAEPEHFDAWIVRTFGRTLADIFMRPYNRKVWGYPLEQLAYDWVDDRIAPPCLDGHEAWGPNRRFRFPRAGGTGAIWRGVAASLPAERLRFGQRAASVDAEARRVQLEDGSTLPYDTLISTLPLDFLVAHSGPWPSGVRAAADHLLHSSVHVIGFGFAGGRPEALRHKTWMYFPESRSPYYRVTVFSNYSPQLVPDEPEAWSLLLEVCESPHHPIDASRLTDQALEALRRDELLGEGAELRSVWHRRFEHGYPTPSIGRNAALAAILPTLEAARIFSRGRFGAWKYEVSNQDHSFIQGVELADRLVLGKPEVTLPDPARCNSGEFLR
jgi:protoporphyrinogen oxidase